MRHSVSSREDRQGGWRSSYRNDGCAHEGGAATAQRQGRSHQPAHAQQRSEEHTSELQSLMRISYAVFCLKKKTEHVTEIKQTTKFQNQIIATNTNRIILNKN